MSVRLAIVAEGFQQLRSARLKATGLVFDAKHVRGQVVQTYPLPLVAALAAL